MKTLGVDPGNTKTAIVFINGADIIDHFYLPNQEALEKIIDISMNYTKLEIYCEMIASYGMPVGKSIFDTCLFIGRIIEAVPETPARAPSTGALGVMEKDVLPSMPTAAPRLEFGTVNVIDVLPLSNAVNSKSAGVTVNDTDVLPEISRPS